MSDIGFAGVADFAYTTTATAVRTMGVTGVGSSSEVVQGPSLGLNFVSAPTGGPVLDPRITFTRTSNATVTNSAGVLTYAPHNLLTFSEQFDNAVWGKAAGTVTANVATAPDGTVTADQIASTGGGVFRGSITVTQGVLHTASVYAKAVSGGGLFLFGFDANPSNGRANFNLSTGAVSNLGVNVVSANAEALADGWYRCTVSAITTSTTCTLVYYNATSGANWLVWGAQLNVGSLQPYYPTTVKNLLGFTQEFDNAAWTKTDWAVTANATTAPDGSLTADRVTRATTTNTFNSISQASVTVVSGTRSTFSCYVKADQYTKFGLREGAISGAYASFNLATGTVIETSGTGLLASITPVGNGWYRCEIDLPITGTSFGVRINPLPNSYTSGSTSYPWAGNTTDGIFIWGAQLSDSASLDAYVYNPGAAPAAAAYYGPRFDYDPVTLAPKGLLIEEQRTNLFLQSFPVDTNNGWGRGSNTTRIGSETMLGQTATIYQGNGSGANTFVNQSVSVTAGVTYTISVYARLVAGPRPTSGALITVETTPGTPGVRANLLYASTTLSSDVARYSLTFTAGATGTSPVYLAADQNNTSQIALMGAQIEVGAFPTSYIPTTTATATRAPDVAVMTGANFSNWYNQSEGTLYVDALRGADVDATIATIAVGTTTTDRIQLHSTTASEYRATYRTGNVEQAALIMSSSTNTPKIAATIKTNDLAASLNGATVVTDTLATLAVYDTFYIGARSDSAIYWNSHIRRLAFFPPRLSNPELQGITA